jgi:enterochelin esterase-like enzyme/ribosomal protein S18 acetylase RimI-like enzyme
LITYRQIVDEDIPALFEIRIATWHNERGAEELAAHGINPETVRRRLQTDHAGWIALADEQPVGFAMANRSNGELWVIAVLAKYEGQGIGKALIGQAEAWLFSHGWDEIWLTTDPDESVRAVGFYRHLGWADWKIDRDRYLRKVNPREAVRLEEHRINCPHTGYQRIVRLKRGPDDRPHRLCLFLDGEHYWRDMDAMSVIEALMRRGEIPAVTVALIGHVSGAARHEDYVCNESYAEYVGETVVSWLRGEVRGLGSSGHVIAGLSLSGLMATFVSLKYPQRFASCLSQSGSHWWRPDWFRRFARGRAPISSRFWLSVGDQETEVGVEHPPTGLFQELSQIEGVEKAVQVLRDIGGTVRHEPYHGGHSMERWREDLERALPWLLATDATAGNGG